MTRSRGAEAAEVAVLGVQRDDEEQGERYQVDQHDHPLRRTRQLERHDPEPEVNLEQDIGQPQRNITDSNGRDRNQHRLTHDALSHRALRQ
jgi:hypothetical protein